MRSSEKLRCEVRNVSLEAEVISETIFCRSDDLECSQQYQSTEGGWLDIGIALNLTRLTSPCYSNTIFQDVRTPEIKQILFRFSRPPAALFKLQFYFRHLRILK